MTIVMNLQICMKATLLAIIILSMVTWLSHMYSCIKNFKESLPSVVSAVIAPKCLFIFSNIIVAYLISESKLSRRRSKLRKTGHDHEPSTKDEDMLQDSQKHEDVLLAEILLPMIIGERKPEQGSKVVIVVDAEKDGTVGNGEDVEMLIAVDEEPETSVVNHGVRENQCEENIDLLVLGNFNKVYKEVKEGGDYEKELQEEVSGDVEEEQGVEEEMGERDLPPADELNQRVEDFIARFNMERQQEEARMLVSCY